MVGRIVRALRGNTVEVVRPGPRASGITRAVCRPPRVERTTQQAIERLRADVTQISDPYPEPHWPSVAAHFAAASSNPRKLDILAALVRWSAALSILEIGTAYGIGTMALASGQRVPKVVTLDPFEPQASIARRHLERVFGSAVEQIAESKVTAIPRLIERGDRFDFVFHDGGHEGDAYVADFEALLPALAPGAVVVIDDIRWDDDPELRARTVRSRQSCHQGWLEVTRHPNVVTALEIRRSIGVIVLS
jgi:predicted O-methyltransferase YrrM